MNPRQTQFAKEYAVDHNATQAAIRAGYSQKTAAQQATRLLKNVQIQKAVTAAEKPALKKLELTHQLVLEGLHGIATNPDTTASARVRAYELLGKHQGMFGDKLEISEMPSAALVEEWIDALEADIQ